MSRTDGTGSGIIGIEPSDGDGSGTYPPPSYTPPPAAPSGSGDGSGTTPTPTPPALPAAASRASSVEPITVREVDSVIIPLAAVPSQELAVSLGQQQCRIALYMRGDALYLDLLLDDAAIARGVACLDRSPMVLAAYTGFVGDLIFFDTQGTSDPTYNGLGTRYLLAWLGV